MKKFLATFILVTILVSLFSVPVMANKTGYLAGDFIDIENHWAYDQMSDLIAMGIVKGYSKTVWDNETGKTKEVQAALPYQSITRAEFATILFEALNLPKTDSPMPFSDKVPSWATAAVSALYRVGIVQGNPDGTFRADRRISRAEIVTMLVRALNDQTSISGKVFSDVPSWHWAYRNIEKAAGMGIINGRSDGRFAPEEGAKRAEVMVMLSQFLLNDKANVPKDSVILSRSRDMLQAMESSINSAEQDDFSSVFPYITGEQEIVTENSKEGINQLKQNGSVSYEVTYPGSVIRKSDRLAEVVYKTKATFKSGDNNMEQNSTEHFYLMKIRDEWYIYSTIDERLL